MKKNKNKIKISSASERMFYAGVNILMFVSILLIILPILNVVSSSISDPMSVLQGEVFLLPKGFSLEGYKLVFRDSRIMSGFANTIFYTFVTTVLAVAITVLAAYPLSRKDLVGRNIFMFLFTLTMLFSGGIIPLYLLVRSLHLIDSRLAVILPVLINAYNIIVARSFFQSTIPDELLEAAKIDGCGNTRFLISIVLPVSKAILAVLALYFGVAMWNSWFSAYLYLNSTSKFPLQLVLKEILLANSMDTGSVAAEGGAKVDALSEVLKYAVILVSCIPAWLVYPFAQKYFIKGVMIGSIKG